MLPNEEAAHPLKLAADVGLAGLDPMRFLESCDSVEVAIMYGVVKHWRERRLELDQSLANKIVETLGKAFKK